MNTIEEACDRIRDYLSKWYNEVKNIRQYLSEEDNVSYAKHLNGGSLYDAKQKFIKENPEYQKFEFDILTGFDVDGSTWRPGCLDGCCQTRAKCRGIYVELIDWNQTRNLALKESKALKLNAEIVYGQDLRYPKLYPSQEKKWK